MSRATLLEPAGRRAITVLSVLLFLAAPACVPRRPLPEPAPSSRQQPDLRASSIENSIHVRINRERTKKGLAPLAWDDRLAGIARNHSIDMGKRRYFSHDSPEGRDFAYRYRTAGYRCEIREGSIIHMGAENIFQNNRYNSMTTVNGRAYYDWNSAEQIAESTVRGWMESPGHRRNILTPHWKSEGVGVYLSPGNDIYITQNFC